MAGLVFQNVSKELRDGQEIRNFSLEVNEGEFVTLTGPNGCGKGELLRMAEGYGGSYTGEVYVDGKRISRFSRGVRRVSLVNDVPLFGTPRWEMTRLLKADGLKKDEIEARIREAAELTGATAALGAQYTALGREMKIRCGMARALATKARVALFIDPLQNLDGCAAESLRATILDFREASGAACLMAAGSQEAALALSTRVVVMKDGQVLQNDTPQNLFDYPADCFVAEYFGFRRINLIPVKLHRAGSDVYAKFGDCEILVPAGKISRLVDEKYAQSEVLMGVRPENIHYEQAFLSMASDTALDVKVRHVEIMGSDTCLHVELPGVPKRVIARVDPRCIASPGDTITLAVDPNRIHFFDANTRQSILSRQ